MNVHLSSICTLAIINLYTAYQQLFSSCNSISIGDHSCMLIGNEQAHVQNKLL